jgi:Fe-S-cluster-containing hydrogenase component 2
MSNGTDIERVLEKDPSLSRIDRREMLRLLAGWAGGALVGATILGAGDARAAEPGETQAKHHYGMVVDTRRCVGCRACTIACKAENKTPPGVFYTLVLEHVIGVDTEDRPTFATKPCFHCEHPSCTVVCPVGATFKRSQDGIVVVDYDRCIGCRYCMTACPYQATLLRLWGELPRRRAADAVRDGAFAGIRTVQGAQRGQVADRQRAQVLVLPPSAG